MPHTSSRLGVAGIHAVESHSVSMFIDGMSLAPTSNSNYLRYTFIRPVNPTGHIHRRFQL